MVCGMNAGLTLYNLLYIIVGHLWQSRRMSDVPHTLSTPDRSRATSPQQHAVGTALLLADRNRDILPGSQHPLRCPRSVGKHLKQRYMVNRGVVYNI